MQYDDSAQFDELEGDETSTVFGDLMSFLTALFILLFTLSYNKELDETFFVKMSTQFGAAEVEQNKILTSQDVFASQVQGYIQDEEMSQYVLVLVDEQRIRLILNDPLLFKPSSSELTAHSKKSLNGFINVIAKLKNPIIIEGHTDDSRVGRKSGFDSNWDLSFGRAYTVLKYFRDKGKISPKRLSAHGYAHYQPLVPNNSVKNRKINRRVEVNVIRISKSQGATI